MAAIGPPAHTPCPQPKLRSSTTDTNSRDCRFVRKGPAILLFLSIFTVMTPVTILLCVWLLGGSVVEPPPDYHAQVQPILQKLCYDCHADGVEKGGISLDSHVDFAAVTKDRILWQRVLENINNGVMPPPDEPQPTPAEVALIEKWIDRVVFHHDCSNPDPGRVTIRRLNREEYNNTIRDLTGVKFRPADDFPADDSGYGFDNIGDVLSLSPVQLEKYLKAAKQVLDEALPTEPDMGTTIKLDAPRLRQSGRGSARGGARVLISSGQIWGDFNVREAGEYLIRFVAHGDQAGNEPVRTELRVDDRPVRRFNVPQRGNAPGTFDERLSLSSGRHRIATWFINDYYNPATREDRNFYVSSIELLGPIKSRKKTEFQSATFDSKNPEQIISRFARQAFRRPVTDEEVQRLREFVELAQENGDSFEGGIKLAFQAVLVSPHFLFRGELQPQPNDPQQVHPIDEHALASRLSYFLWSSMPDEDLMRLADDGRLRDNLDHQIRRMMADPKALALVRNFGGQWLQIRNLDLVQPDEKMFSTWDDELRRAMRRETELLFDRIQDEDRSIIEFLNADYTFMNERLATHYGRDDVRGNRFIEVSLRDGERRGVLAHASILTITSHPDRTSPVKRGQWVLNNLLGTPPPPAPADVPTLEDQGRKLTGNLRQRMEQHRENKICASCHQLMDPIGFGLENYDALGRWRDQDEGTPIDPSGTLTTGDTFNGPRELTDILTNSRRDLFVRNLTRTMLTYALGRGLEHYDKCAVKKIVAHLEENDHRFSALVRGIVHSVPFQMRRGEKQAL